MRTIASWDERRRRLDVRLWHPSFERAPLPLRQQAVFLFLDNLLGEDDVERWIGTIEPLEAPAGGRTPAELMAEVRRRAAESVQPDSWLIAQRVGPAGEVAIVMANAALKRIDHPFADKHVEIRLPIEGGGMPDAALAERLNAEEDRLMALIGAAAALAGRTTTPGERVIHLVAGDLEPVYGAIDAWAKDLPPWRIKVQPKVDPRWVFQKDLGVR
jgi:hypothetical protein